MKRSLPLTAGLLLLAAIAVLAYFGATGLMDSIYAYRSPLKDAPPAPADPLGAPLTRRVVFVLVDALRYDTSLDEQVMPVLASLRANAARGEMSSRPPSFSQPGYSTLLTGAWSEINDGPVVNLDKAQIPTFTQDDLFSAVHRAGLTTAVSGYDWFEMLIPQNAVDYSFYTPGEDAAADRQVVDAALPWLENNRAILTLIHIDQVDYAGHHEGGADSPAWAAAASRADALIGEIVARLDLTRDTLLVVSDHGQIDRGGHGGAETVTLREPFVLAGAGVVPGDYTGIRMVDVAPTLAVLLGANLPASAQGRALTEMLVLDAAQRDNLQIAAREQHRLLLASYADALDADIASECCGPEDPLDYINLIRQERLNAERLPRAGLALLILAAIGYVIIRLWKRDTAWMLAGAALFLLLFHLWFVVIERRGYSLSAIDGVTWLVTTLLVSALVGLLLAGGLTGLASGALKRGRRPAAGYFVGLALMAIALLALPTLWSFVLNGALVTWTLPDVGIASLALFAMILMLAAAAAGLLLAAAAALVAPLLVAKSKA